MGSQIKKEAVKCYAISNILRDLRGKRTQLEMATISDIHIRTYINLENGKPGDFCTLQSVMDAMHANPLTRASLVRAWIEHEVGDENWRLVHSKQENPEIVDQITELVLNLKTEDQQDLLEAIRSPQVVACLRNLTEIARIAAKA